MDLIIAVAVKDNDTVPVIAIQDRAVFRICSLRTFTSNLFNFGICVEFNYTARSFIIMLKIKNCSWDTYNWFIEVYPIGSSACPKVHILQSLRLATMDQNNTSNKLDYKFGSKYQKWIF